MNRFTIYPCLILLLLALPLLAQNGMERITETLMQKAEAGLTAAEELNRSFPDVQAKEWLRQARQYYNEGHSAFVQRQFIIAQAKFRLAIDFARRAGDVLSKVPLSRMQEQVEELLRRAEQSVSGTNDKESERLLSRAREHIRMARRMAQQNQYQRGLEYLRIARFLLDQSLNLGQGARGDLRDLALVEKERFGELLQRTESALAGCSNTRAHNLFQQAQKQIPNINQAFAQGDYRLAVQWYGNVTRLLLRVVDLCQGREMSDREQVLEELEFLNHMLGTAADRFIQHATPKEQLVLQRANGLHQQAVQAIAAEQYDLALRRIELARALITRLWYREAAPQRIESEIERVLAELQQQRQAVNNGGTSSYRPALLQAVEHHARMAQRFHAAHRPRAALVSLLVADRLLTIDRGAEAAQTVASTEQIQTDLEKCNQQLQQLSSTISDQEDKELYRSARSLYERALECSQNRQWSLAASYLAVSRLILEKITL